MNWVLFQSDWVEWSGIFARNFPNQTWPELPPAPETRQQFLEDTARLHDLTLLEFIETIEDFAFRPVSQDASKSQAA